MLDMQPGADHADRRHPPGHQLTRELLGSLGSQRVVTRSPGCSGPGAVPVGARAERMLTMSSSQEPTNATAGHVVTTALDGPWPRPCATLAASVAAVWVASGTAAIGPGNRLF
jgi:hypothetical protein